MAEDFDPTDVEMVADAAAKAWAGVHPGVRILGSPERVTAATSTWVWFVELGGDVPPDWQGAQVLRLFRPDQHEVAVGEHALIVQLGAHRFPVASTRWQGTLGGTHPALLQERLAGRPAAEVLTGPKLRQIVRRLGSLQATLHAIDPGNLALPRFGAPGYLEHDLAPRRSAVVADDPLHIWEFLCDSADRFDLRDGAHAVLCHGDFHPLNAIVAPDGGIGVIDWTDASISDRHHDVARSIAIFWFASILADSTAERVALRLLRDRLGRMHRRAYEQEAGVMLDPARLSWWQIVHLYRGWLQLAERAEEVVDDHGSSTTDRFPPDLSERLLARCQTLRDRVEEGSAIGR